MEKYQAISVEQCNQIGNYLVNQPYKDVAHLIAILYSLKPIEEQPPPAAKPEDREAP